MTATATSGSSATRPSSTLASVGHSNVRSMPMSFIEGQTRLGVEEGVDAGHGPHLGQAEAGIARLGLAVTLGDVTAVAARDRNLAEGRVRDVVADLVPDGQLGPAVDIDVLDDAVVLPGNELRQGVPVLVQVVVGVEGAVRKPPLPNIDKTLTGFAHGTSLSYSRTSRYPRLPVFQT